MVGRLIGNDGVPRITQELRARAIYMGACDDTPAVGTAAVDVEYDHLAWAGRTGLLAEAEIAEVSSALLARLPVWTDGILPVEFWVQGEEDDIAYSSEPMIECIGGDIFGAGAGSGVGSQSNRGSGYGAHRYNRPGRVAWGRRRQAGAGAGVGDYCGEGWGGGQIDYTFTTS